MSGVLLFDGDCGFCTTSANWLHRHVISAAQVLPWQQVDLAALGLSTEDCSRAVQWVDGREREEGVVAISSYLQTSTRFWRRIGSLLTAPVVRSVSGPVYQGVARLSSRLPGGTPASEQPRISTRVKGIRRRRKGDVGAAARLLRVVYSDGEYPQYWPDSPHDWLSNERVLESWVAVRHGELLGHVSITEVGEDPVSALRWREITGHVLPQLAAVSRFYVRPRVQGQGIGSALLDIAEAEIRARGLLPVLEVVSSSSGVIELFEKRGWHLIATHSWGDKNEHRRLFWYELPPVSTDH